MRRRMDPVLLRLRFLLAVSVRITKKSAVLFMSYVVISILVV